MGAVHACGGTTGDGGTTDGTESGNHTGGGMVSGGGGADSFAGSAGFADRASGGTSGAGVVGTGGSPAGGLGGDGVGGRSAAGSSGAAGQGVPGPSPCAQVGYRDCFEAEWMDICQDCEATGVVAETCIGGTRISTQTPCAPHRCTDEAVPGADVDCEPGQICVVHRSAGGAALSMECVDNPCGSSFIDQDCAEAFMCPDDRLAYPGTDDGGVSVDCYAWPPDCPTSPPEVAEPCPLNGESCVYQDCADYGLIQAQCDEGLWTIYTDACRGGECGSSNFTCEVGEICAITAFSNLVASTAWCAPPPDEPGLVAQGTLVCTYGAGSADITPGIVRTICTCSLWGC